MSLLAMIEPNEQKNFVLHLKKIAYEYWQLGLNIVPVREKTPLIKWTELQSSPQSSDDFISLPWNEADGFALIGGAKKIDGLYLGAIDYDVKNVSDNAKELGKKFLKELLATRIEKTPSGGEHWVFYSRKQVGTVSNFHDLAALELLGSGKLIIMAPSKGYTRMNDNELTVLEDLESTFYKGLYRIGLKKPEKVTRTVPAKRRRKVQARMCCEAALEKNRHVSHLMRLAIAGEYKRLGWSESDIVDLFRHQDDFDREKCQVQVRSADPNKTASCESIKSWGYCLPECPLREWTLQEAIEREWQKANSVELHPYIDYHPETGLTIGVYLGESHQLVQIINKKAFMVDSESRMLEDWNPLSIQIKEPIPLGLSREQMKEILLMAREAEDGGLSSKNGEKNVSDKVLHKVLYYFYHSDPRWHLASSCFVIATYLHRLFLFFPHLVFQGPRGSGKSTIALLLSMMCWNPTGLQAGLRSAPLFRSVEAGRPTFFADLTKVNVRDVDLIDLFEIIEQNGYVRRCVGEENKPQDFYIFCPKVLSVRQSVPFSHKVVECVTETAPKGSPYTERRRFISLDSELKDIRVHLLRSVINTWQQVLEAYGKLQQDDKLFGRRFDLWSPLLAVCKVYYPDRYSELLSLAYEDAERSERGDITSDVEDCLLSYFFTFKTEDQESQTFALKDLTDVAQKQLGLQIVRSYHIVASALKNLGIIKRKTQTTKGINHLIDLVKAHRLAEERKIQEFNLDAQAEPADSIMISIKGWCNSNRNERSEINLLDLTDFIKSELKLDDPRHAIDEAFKQSILMRSPNLGKAVVV